MIKFEWMMSCAICDGMFDNAFFAFEDAKRVKENSETIVIVATKPAAFLEANPNCCLSRSLPDLRRVEDDMGFKIQHSDEYTKG